MARRGCVRLLDPPVLEAEVWAGGALTIPEAAELLLVGPRKVREMLRRGELPFGRAGGRTVLPRSHVLAVVDARWRCMLAA